MEQPAQLRRLRSAFAAIRLTSTTGRHGSIQSTQLSSQIASFATDFPEPVPGSLPGQLKPLRRPRCEIASEHSLPPTCQTHVSEALIKGERVKHIVD